MRFALALVAVMALLVSPVTAAAAQAACGHGESTASSGMDMPAKAGATHAIVSASDPCCDHSTDQHKMSDKSCAQACATSCAVAAALPSSLVSLSPVYTRAPVTLARQGLVPLFQPSGPERPPKSMA
jgi:hypothetical protein